MAKLIYLSHTRPNIGYSVSMINQFMDNPNEKHMEAVYEILRYLKLTPRNDLYYEKSTNKIIKIYSDAK